MTDSTMFGVSPENAPRRGFSPSSLGAGHRARVPEQEARARGLASYKNALSNLETSTPGTPRRANLVDFVESHPYRPGADRVPIARRNDEADRLRNFLSGNAHDSIDEGEVTHD